MTNETNKALDVITDKIISTVNSKISRLGYDQTFPSVIYGISKNGEYTIIKAGQKYDVKCAMPITDLKIGTNVWVRIPCGRLHDMHICGLR